MRMMSCSAIRVSYKQKNCPAHHFDQATWKLKKPLFRYRISGACEVYDSYTWRTCVFERSSAIGSGSVIRGTFPGISNPRETTRIGGNFGLSICMAFGIKNI